MRATASERVRGRVAPVGSSGSRCRSGCSSSAASSRRSCCSSMASSLAARPRLTPPYVFPSLPLPRAGVLSFVDAANYARRLYKASRHRLRACFSQRLLTARGVGAGDACRMPARVRRRRVRQVRLAGAQRHRRGAPRGVHPSRPERRRTVANLGGGAQSLAAGGGERQQRAGGVCVRDPIRRYGAAVGAGCGGASGDDTEHGSGEQPAGRRRLVGEQQAAPEIYPRSTRE